MTRVRKPPDLLQLEAEQGWYVIIWLRSPTFLVVPHSPLHFPTMHRSAIKALRPGGLLVYSTCTLSRAENQDVISEILTSNSTIVPVDISGLARTCSQDFTFAPTDQKCSLLVLPEKGKAWGPMFIAKLKKIVSTGKWWHNFVSRIDVFLYAYYLSTLCVSTYNYRATLPRTIWHPVSLVLQPCTA